MFLGVSASRIHATLTPVVQSRSSRKAFGPWYRRTLATLGPPPVVLVSEHAVPDPEIYGAERNVVVFEAIRKAASRAGLVLGIPQRPERKQAPSWVWGERADQAVDAALRLVASARPPYEDGAWPTGLIVWSDRSRTTFLAVIADPDCNFAKEIVAWGKNAEACLAAVNQTLDDAALWD